MSPASSARLRDTWVTEGGQLTEAVRRKPYSVVLFDEIEKAHPDVFNILLQVLDDGRITDSQGRTVDFKNTIIILTSNLGSPYILDGIRDRRSRQAQAQVDALLKQSFRPEFLNRLDEIVYYKPLTKEEIGGVVDLLLQTCANAWPTSSWSWWSPAAKQAIVDGGYDPIYGARPLKRYIQQKVETLVARHILADDPAPARPSPWTRKTAHCFFAEKPRRLGRGSRKRRRAGAPFARLHRQTALTTTKVPGFSRLAGKWGQVWSAAPSAFFLASASKGTASSCAPKF